MCVYMFRGGVGWGGRGHAVPQCMEHRYTIPIVHTHAVTLGAVMDLIIHDLTLVLALQPIK